MAPASSRHNLTVLTPQGEFTLKFQTGAKLRDILLSAGFVVRSACGGNAVCGQCQVRVAESSGIPFLASERLRLTGEQLQRGLRLSCCVTPSIDLHVSLEIPEQWMTWRTLRDDECSELDIADDLNTSFAGYGCAIDLGTTHIRLTLWNLATGKRIAGRVGLNPQGSYGADVLTRLTEASRSNEIAHEMSSLVQQAIAEALASCVAQASIELEDVVKVLIVGNTAMLSLLANKNFALLLQPENWTRIINCQPEDINILSAVWNLSTRASIRFMTCLGGFIGSDLLAGVISTRLIEQPAGSLLIDFGTNSEMALWDGHTLHVTSTAGGPAFEGCGISCGIPGESGAIYRVAQQGEDAFNLRVLGDSEPKGICGSGLVDAVAWLRRNGKLDKLGRFTRPESAGFVLHEGENSIVLKCADIDVLQRAKAAIGGGVRWLCRQAGLPLASLQQVYASGAFGRLLDVSNAQQIGLLPPVPIASVKLEGNTALAGCETILLSSTEENVLEDVLAVCKVYNMAEDTAFETFFIESLYLESMQE